MPWMTAHISRPVSPMMALFSSLTPVKPGEVWTRLGKDYKLPKTSTSAIAYMPYMRTLINIDALVKIRKLLIF
jgi:hypothetical protein